MSNPTQPPHDSGSGECALTDEQIEAGFHAAGLTGAIHTERSGKVEMWPASYRKDMLSIFTKGANFGYRAALATPSQAPEPIAPERPSTAEWLYCVDTLWEKARGDMPDGMCGWFQARKFAALLENEMGRADSEPATPSQAVASALPAAEGWKLVPIEPTVEMLMAAEDAYDSSSFRERRMYAAMLAAAPAHPVVQSGIQGSGHQAGASLLLACDSDESEHQARHPERAAFERACGYVGAPRRETARGDGGEYCAVRAQGAWDAWQAARAVPTLPTNGDAPPSLYKRLADGTYLEAAYGEIAKAHKAQGTWPFDGTGEAS